MEIAQQNSGLQSLARVTRTAARFLPEPAATGVGIFRDVMNSVKGVVSRTTAGIDTALPTDFMELLEMQIEAQREMQATSMLSNTEKAKHESKMAAIRNIRVS